MKQKIILVTAALILPLAMWANNIRIKLNGYNATTKQLNITIAWDNSWHDGSGQFRDAAWLFVKYKDVTNPEWQHAILANPTGAGVLATDTLNSPGVRFDVLGRNASVAPNPVGSRGYIVRRQKSSTVATQNNPEYAGVYNVAMTINATLVLPTGVVLANPEFRVYALEMVDIPAGAFWAGDGTSFSYVRANASHQPKQISTEAAFQFSSDIGYTVNVQAAFPKGTYEYFTMKYELSNEAFAEYLNTLTRSQQNAVVGIAYFSTLATGNFVLPKTIVTASVSSENTPAAFGCDANSNNILNELNDGQNKGFGCFNHGQMSAYLDWAALRPLTGYEYEKACRGPLYPIAGEYAWGSAVVTPVSINVDVNGPSESTSAQVDGPISMNGGYYNSSIRNGCYAKAVGSNRVNSGGSYFGVMELSNGYHELHIGYGYATTWTGFTGALGDGTWSSNNIYLENAMLVKNNLNGVSRAIDQGVPTYVDDNNIIAIRGVIR